MFEVGDLVTRNSYHNDIVFRIIKIDNDNCLLMGTSIRLVADAPSSDLKSILVKIKMNFSQK